MQNTPCGQYLSAAMDISAAVQQQAHLCQPALPGGVVQRAQSRLLTCTDRVMNDRSTERQRTTEEALSITSDNNLSVSPYYQPCHCILNCPYRVPRENVCARRQQQFAHFVVPTLQGHHQRRAPVLRNVKQNRRHNLVSKNNKEIRRWLLTEGAVLAHPAN
jgi:hypothetical protein